MLPFLAKTLICSGLFYGLYYFLLRKETFFQLNRLFLLTTLLLSAIIPLLHISLHIETSATESFFYTLINGTKEFFFVYLLDEVVIYGKASPFSWYNIIEKIYFAGIFVFAIRILIFLYKIFKINLNSRKYKTNGIALFAHNKPYSAFSFGNAIYANKDEIKSSDFKVIWKHEVAHISLWHTFESFILEVFCCFFWFNPFVWAMKKQLKDIHEYQADNLLVQNGINSLIYQQHLLNYTIDGYSFATTNNFATTALKNRIGMLAKRQSNRWKKGKLGLALPVLLVLLFAFSTDFVTFSNQEKNKPIDVIETPTNDSIPIISE